MSALVDRYGCRSMTIFGGMVSALGFLVSSWAQSIVIMYFTFGVVTGAGLGIIYVTSVVSVTYWFDERRNLAMGLATCGVGMGTFLFAPCIQFSVAQIGWRSTVMLLSSTFFCVCVCGTAMNDPSWTKQKQEK